MTREEAIKSMEYSKAQAEITLSKGVTQYWKQEINWTIEAIDMAIEALERERTDEWCTDCKEYDTEKKCCPRFNRVIRGATKRIPHDDGTLEVKVEDATKIGRVLISDDKHRGGLYYPDEGEPKGDLISRKAAKDIAFRSPFFSDALMEELDALPSADRPTDGDLISRADAIEAIELVDWYHQNSGKDMIHGANDDEHQAWYKAQDIYKALEAVPSADRPRGEWIPCTERMPGDGKWAIWCSNDGVIGIARFKEDCYNHFYPNGTSFGLEDAVAWMPLPEPYKGGDDK